MTIVLGSILASPPPKAVWADVSATPLIEFETRVTPRATFLVDPALNGRVQPLIDRMVELLQEQDRLEEQAAETLTHRDEYLASINRLLGLKPDAEAAAVQREAFAYFATVLRLRFGGADALTITLVDQTNAKNHLRAGGALPLTDYNRVTDIATVRHSSTSKNGTETPPIDELIVLVNDDKPIRNAGDDWFEFGEMGLTVAFHEVVESSFIQGWAKRRVDPHWRWFSDGLANAVALHILEQHGLHEEAQSLRNIYDDRHFEKIKDELNLRYWLEKRFEPQVEDFGEDDLRLARYGAALHEVQQLIDDHGTGWIAPVIADLQHSGTPGSAAILESIQRHTGTDMNPRLDRYQTFQTRDEGIERYATEYGQAMQAGDHEAALSAATRLVELQFTSIQDGPSPQSYLAVAQRLIDLGMSNEAEAMRRQVMGK